MATKSEVFGRCVGEIDVSVEVKDEDGWLRCELYYLGFILVKKAAKDWQ